MLRRLASAAVALLVLAPACGSENASAEIDRNEEVPVKVTFKVSGDLNFTFEDTVMSRFIVFRTKDSELQDAQLVGFEPIDPIKIGDAVMVAGAGVTPYRGDGTYTMKAGSPGDAYKEAAEKGEQPKPSSGIKLDWWPTGDMESQPERYVRRVKPCTVEVEGRGTRGVVRCPDVTTEEPSKHISVEMRWEAPTTPAPTTTEPPADTTEPPAGTTETSAP